MESGQNTQAAPVVYNSLFTHGVDEKRRVQIPSKWRPTAEGFEFTLVIWPGSEEGPCLRVLPPTRLALLMKTLDEMSNSDPTKTAMLRELVRKSEQVTLDKAGRVVLPEHMAAAAGIKDQAIMVGLLHTFEIWNPQRHKQAEAADRVMAPQDSFRNLLG
jgi:MraZ protein